MSLRCALTGMVATVPVINIKNGRVYDQHAINQHLAINQTDPFTNEPLQSKDLIPISTESLMIPPVQSLSQSSSLREALQTVNREFDGLMLEQFQLKKENQSLKQELAHALYQHDAATRVIARLIKERDDAKAELNHIATNPIHRHPAQPNGSDQMEVDAEQSNAQSNDQNILNQIIVDCAEQLSKKRKATIKHLKTTIQPAQSISQMKLVASVKLGSDQSPVTSHCMDVDYQSISQSSNQSMPLGLAVSGNSDGSISVIDCSKSSVIETLRPSAKRITDITFVQPSQYTSSSSISQSNNHWTSLSTTSPLPFLSASSDGSASLYSYTSDSSSNQTSYRSLYRTTHHSGPVSLSVHPSSLTYVTAGLDGRWHLNEMNTGRSINQFVNQAHNQSIGFSAVSFHPDGRIIGVAATDQTFKVFDASSASVVGSFKGHTAAPLCVAFSPNGLHACTGDADHVIKLWDLRYVSPDANKPLNFQNLTLHQAINSVVFDESASNLVIASGGTCHVYETKTWQQIWTSEQSNNQTNGHDKVDMTSVRVAPRFDMVHTASSTGIVNVYQTPQGI